MAGHSPPVDLASEGNNLLLGEPDRTLAQRLPYGLDVGQSGCLSGLGFGWIAGTEGKLDRLGLLSDANGCLAVTHGHDKHLAQRLLTDVEGNALSEVEEGRRFAPSWPSH